MVLLSTLKNSQPEIELVCILCQYSGGVFLPYKNTRASEETIQKMTKTLMQYCHLFHLWNIVGILDLGVKLQQEKGPNDNCLRNKGEVVLQLVLLLQILPPHQSDQFLMQCLCNNSGGLILIRTWMCTLVTLSECRPLQQRKRVGNYFGWQRSGSLRMWQGKMGISSAMVFAGCTQRPSEWTRCIAKLLCELLCLNLGAE